MDEVMMTDEVKEILSFFIISKDELLIIGGIILAIIILSIILPRIAFFLYEHLSSGATQDILREIIYSLDKLADDLSNKEKRKEAVYKLQAVFSFKGIRMPKFILGWIIDMEVRHIRNLQKECKKESDLHHENEDD